MGVTMAMSMTCVCNIEVGCYGGCYGNEHAYVCNTACFLIFSRGIYRTQWSWFSALSTRSSTEGESVKPLK